MKESPDGFLAGEGAATHLGGVHSLGDGLLGVGHGLQLASGVFHLAGQDVQTLGHLLGLLHGGRGRTLTSGVEHGQQSATRASGLGTLLLVLFMTRIEPAEFWRQYLALISDTWSVI